MTALVWDEIGARRYETGIDRGVLYTSEGIAVPWNGLTAVTEDRDREIKSYFLDGIKYLDHSVPGSFKGRLSALTYPEELDEMMGTSQFAPGIFIHDQNPRMFDLSWRTGVGDDLQGMDHGFKIHILYNVTANPSSVTHTTIGNTVTPGAFEWALFGTPARMQGIRPTTHISIYSAAVDPDLLTEIEEILYGTESVDPELPNIVELLGMVETFA